MSEPKFTPGPWHKGAGDYRCDVFDKKAWRNPDGSRGGETPNLIITLTSENEDADAHLIAAAPELYEACEAVIRYQKLAESDANTGLLMSYTEAYIKAEAALAKARGEA